MDCDKKKIDFKLKKKLEMNETEVIEVQIESIKYTLILGGKWMVINANTHDKRKKWGIKISEENYQELLPSIKKSSSWEQIKEAIKSIFEDEYPSTFEKDEEKDTMTIDCNDKNVIKFIGSITIDLQRESYEIEEREENTLSDFEELAKKLSSISLSEPETEKRIENLETFSKNMIKIVRSLSMINKSNELRYNHEKKEMNQKISQLGSQIEDLKKVIENLPKKNEVDVKNTV